MGWADLMGCADLGSLNTKPETLNICYGVHVQRKFSGTWVCINTGCNANQTLPHPPPPKGNTTKPGRAEGRGDQIQKTQKK